MAVDARLPVPDQRLRQPAEPLQAPGDAREQVLGLRREHQNAGARAREAQTGDDNPAAAALTVPDRDLGARLPDVELANLARPIDRPLKRPRRRRKQRPDLAQIVIDDRLGRRAAQRLEQLADPDPRQLGVVLEQPMDLVLEGIELGPRRRAAIDRRLVAVDRLADRVAMQPRPPTNLALRQALDEVQPTDLCPLLHPDHLGPPELALRKRAQAPRATGQHDRWPTFHPAQVVQFSPGADTGTRLVGFSGSWPTSARTGVRSGR